MLTTIHYIIRDSRFVDIVDLLPLDIQDAALDAALDELADLRHTIEMNIKVYELSVSSKTMDFVEPRLYEALTNHALDTKQKVISIFQWNAPDIFTYSYCLPKGRKMVDIEEVIGATDSDEFWRIMAELDTKFKPLEDTEPALVRVASLGAEELAYSEDLAEALGRELPQGDRVYVYEWTE